MASKSGCKPRSLRLFPRRDNISLLENYVIVNVMLKTMWGETEGIMLVVRQGRWEGSEVGKVAG